MTDSTDDVDYWYDGSDNDTDRYGSQYWAKRDGSDILIKDMKTSHIINCIRMLHKKELCHIELEAELGRRTALGDNHGKNG